ncbi:MAG: COX15/CtaA family protein [Sphingomonadaceae bacterium]
MLRSVGGAARPALLVHWLGKASSHHWLVDGGGRDHHSTESGLSITEWKPITGAIPPLSEAQQAEFAAYTSNPSNIRVLLRWWQMLADYKFIYFGNGALLAGRDRAGRCRSQCSG